MPGHDIIVVGASAGGVEALSTLVRGLPAELPASVFIVLHIAPQSPSLLPQILNHIGALPVVAAVDGAEIERGTIYCAPADHHLMLDQGRVRVVRGPKENRHRPAVDPLFRSAALAYGPRVVGVVLTGSLDDGTAGLQAVKLRGGVAVVQDPEDAFYPSMPQSALNNVAVDHCLPVAALPALLAELARSSAPVDAPAPSREMELEVRIVEMDSAVMQGDERPGTPSAFSCPECKGVLWELHEGGLVRFRCRTGHAFSAESVLAEQAEALENALYMALNTLEERAVLSRRMAERAREHGHRAAARRFDQEVQEAEARATVIRKVLLKDETMTAASDALNVTRAAL
jgi:two-component system chemotaxis response regulator CheB